MTTTRESGPRARIDTTMMYAVHDAFQRDLDTLVALAGTGDVDALRTGWNRFRTFLHIHHTAEDTHLWPVLEDKLTRTGRAAGLAVLSSMEAEHTGLTALLDAMDAALAEPAPPPRRVAHARRLADALTAHCEHEEEAALPLVEELLTPQEWRAFGDEQRHRLGRGGAATFLPWLLDGADEDRRRKVLGYLPPPARLLYRAVWRPRYLRRPRWEPRAAAPVR
ncbi:MAG: hemerythrin domain-containing protein [Mycobacteriales bacterium]